MEALLGAPSNSQVFGSVPDLQNELARLLSVKAAEARAEHISTTLGILSTVVFAIPTSDADNDGEPGSTPDAQLGAALNGDDQAVRRISAGETLANQPHNDPVLQRMVAKHLIAALGAVDTASWTLRQVSRATQDWTFTYICKNSTQAWERQHAKRSSKTAIGEWSNNDSQDPINMSRPAFDCQGSVTVSFSKSSRAINVKYEHTPFHKSVGELLELFAPPPPLPPVATRDPAPRKAPRTPKKARRQTEGATTQEEGVGASTGGGPRKRRNITEGGGGQSKRRKKKDSEGARALEADMQLPEAPGALPVGEPSERPLYNTQSQLTTQGGGVGVGATTSGSYPEGLVGASSTADSAAQASSAVPAGAHNPSVLNLPPGEIERRREVATQLLTSSDIDPQTLSEEQFNIFANQSPDLQKESLAMLAKYGAERLRIVHPNKEAQAQAQTHSAATAASEIHGVQSSPGGGEEAVDHANGAPAAAAASEKPKKASKRKSAAAAAGGDGETLDKTRGIRPICERCRNKRIKCDRLRPYCGRCVDAGADCVYAARKSGAHRKRRGQAEDDEPDQAGDQSGTLPPPPPPPDDTGGASATDPATDPTSYPAHTNHNHNNMASHQSSYPDPSASGLPYASSLSYSSQPASDLAHQHQDWAANAGMEYGRAAQDPVPSSPSVPDDPPASSDPPQYPEQTAPDRLSNIAMSQADQPQQYHFSAPQASTSNVHAANPPANLPPSRRPAGPPELVAATAVATSPKQPKPRRPTAGSAYHSRNMLEGMRQAAEIPQAGNNLPPQPSPPVQAPSYSRPTSTTTTARDRSQQGTRAPTRAPTRTPVQNRSAARQPQPPAAQASSNSGSNTNMAYPTPAPSNAAYSPYSRPADAETIQAGNRIPYGSYTQQQQPGTSVSPAYPSYDAYNSQAQGSSSTPTPLPNPSTQGETPSYVAAPPQSASPWGAMSTSTQARHPNPLSYNIDPTTSSPSTNSPYNNNTSATNITSASVSGQQQQQQQPSLVAQSFRMRPRANNTSHHQSNKSGSYGRLSQPQQQQQQQSSYASYAAAQQQQQQQQPTNAAAAAAQHENWYGFAAAAAAAAATTADRSGSAGGYHPNNTMSGHYSQQQQQQQQQHHHQPQHPHQHLQHQHHQQQHQQHHPMNLSSHTYSSIDNGDQAIYNLLRGNPGT